MPELSFDDGAIIFQEGDKPGPVYLVESGMVRISKSGKDAEMVLGEVGKGGIFGEMALIDSSPRMATATAVGTTVCFATPVAQMQRKLALLGPEVAAFYGEMIAYIRDTLPYDDRPVSGETSADRKAAQLVEKLPDFIARLQHPPPVVVTLLERFGSYIERRLPPSLVVRRAPTSTSADAAS